MTQKNKNLCASEPKKNGSGESFKEHKSQKLQRLKWPRIARINGDDVFCVNRMLLGSYHMSGDF